MADQALADVGVLVTRPTHQALDLAEAIEARGGTAICFPVIDIVARDAAETVAAAAALRDPDVVIYVSRNAVQFGLSYAAAASIGAVGPATAGAIEAAGRQVDIKPASGFDSEHLLAEPA